MTLALDRRAPAFAATLADRLVPGAFVAATGFSPAETIAKGLLPFLLGDALKLLLAAGALPCAGWIVGRER